MVGYSIAAVVALSTVIDASSLTNDRGGKGVSRRKLYMKAPEPEPEPIVDNWDDDGWHNDGYTKPICKPKEVSDYERLLSVNYIIIALLLIHFVALSHS